MKERKDIAEKYKWDLSEYFASDKAWDTTFAEVESKYQKISEFEGKLNNEKDIFDCMTFESELSKKIGRLYVYASLRTREDQSDSIAQERLEKISSLGTKISATSSFVSVEISELSNEFLTTLQNNPNHPEHSDYFRDIIRFKPHTLSKKEERLLSLTGDFSGGFGDNFDKFDDADLTFESVKDSEGNLHELDHTSYHLFIESPDRTLRKNAMIAYHDSYKKYNNFLASNYISHLKANKFYASIRNFPSALQSSIFAEEASEEVYKTLIEQVGANLPTLHRYLELKRRQLKLDKIAVYDFYANTAEAVNLKLEFEDAMQVVKQATAVLGEDYTALLGRAHKEKWIDVMPNKNKDSGAFAWGAYGAHPVVLLNYVKTTNSVFTLAHELGHCMHTYHSNKYQPYEKAGYTIFVAEVASTVNEMLLLEHLLKLSKTEEEKIYYYDYLLRMVRGTIFRQTMFSEFEAFAHNQVEKDLPISKDVLNNFYTELNKKYFGPKTEIVDELNYEWSRIPHFYNSFYVYKYSTGLISALAITNKILSGEKDTVANYKKFLSSGCSLPPVELLKIAGVNLEDKQSFDSAFQYVNSILDRWEEFM